MACSRGSSPAASSGARTPAGELWQSFWLVWWCSFFFFFLFYFCFPSSFAAVCLSVWAFLQVSSPFTAVNPHKAILRVKGHQLPQLANLFCSCVQRGRAAGKVPSGGRGKGGNVAMYYSRLSMLLEVLWPAATLLNKPGHTVTLFRATSVSDLRLPCNPL